MMATTTETMTAPAQSGSDTPKLSNDHSSHPPIEKFLTIDGLLKSHASESAEPPLICYPARGVSDYEEHTAKALDKFTDAAVARYLELGLEAAVSDHCIGMLAFANLAKGSEQCGGSGGGTPCAVQS